MYLISRPMENQNILTQIKKDDIKFIKLQFTDLVGGIKSVTIPVDQLEHGLQKGIWFDGSSIEGFARIQESDMILMPDVSTYSVLPWRPTEKGVARIICDVLTPDMEPYESDPRHILKKVVKEAADLGFEFYVGPELEFFLFKNDEDKLKAIPHDSAGYFDYSPRDLAADVRRDIVFALEKMGINVEMSHHECAPGQHEIDFKYDTALKTADNAITFKYVVKSIAHAHGLFASFMPKPLFGVAGNGMHVHQSIFDIATRKNLFFDNEDEYKLSKTAKHFIAGQLKHIREMTAILNPTVNSYKRLVSGFEAPVYICWAQKNRSALIRIPRYAKGREQSVRAELRSPDTSCNPYLAFAAMLKAGLDGIKNGIDPGSAINEDVYAFNSKELDERGIKTLPNSLWQAIKKMKQGELIKDLLGKTTFEKYLDARTKEWDDYRVQVTPWEMKRYFEIL